MKMRILFFLIFIVAAIPAAGQEHAIRTTLDTYMGKVSQERLKANIEKLAGFHNRNTFSDTVSAKQGIGAARRWLLGEFELINRENSGHMKVYFDRFEQPLGRYEKTMNRKTWPMCNVVAVIPGRSSERILQINAHYDSRNASGTDDTQLAAGADDDGSGTAALLEIARILSGEELANTVMLVATVAEEQGLWGATHQAKAAKEEQWPLEGVIANDMIGNSRGGGGQTDNTVLRCFSDDPDISPSRNLALFVKRVSDRYVPQMDLKMIFRLDRFGRGGDHSPFVREGFAGIRFTEPWENYAHQHSPYDLPEYMDFEYYTRTVQLNVAVAAYWAQTPAPPELVSVSRTKDYRTKLQFTCTEDKKNLAGFRIYTRQTDSGYWTEDIFIPGSEKQKHRYWGEVYSAELTNRDQDYYIFGVASVAKNAYESIASTYDRARLRRK